MNGGIETIELLPPGNTMYKCRFCRTTVGSDIWCITNRYRGINGRAYLFENLININLQDKRKVSSSSGVFHVRNVVCCGCRKQIGCYYDLVEHVPQKYRERRFELVRCLTVLSFGH